MVEDPVKLGYPGWGGGSIGEDDWIALKYLIDCCDVETICEVGIGLSTFLLQQKAKRLVGYDTLERHLVWMRERLNGAVELRQWDGKTPFDPGEYFDMAFIDGPTGAKLRKPSFKSMVGKCRVLAMHDTGYIWNDVWRFELDPEGKYECIWPGGRFSAWAATQ